MNPKIKQSPIVEINTGCFPCLGLGKANKVYSSNVEEKTDIVKRKNIPPLDFSKLSSNNSISTTYHSNSNWIVGIEID